jgi:hypothetical protein
MFKSIFVGLFVMLFAGICWSQMWIPENQQGTAAIIGGKKTLEETAGDVALRDKLLNLHFAVDYYDDSDISESRVTGEVVGAHDLIIASESSSSSRLRHLMRWGFSTPTINMEPASVQNSHHKLELIHAVATGNGWMPKRDENGNKFKILDTDHPLAAGFPAGQVLEVIPNPEEYVTQYPFAEGILGYMVDDIGVIPIASFNTPDGDTALVICGIEVGTLNVDSVRFNERYVQFNFHSNTVPTWKAPIDSLFVAAINWVLASPTKVADSRAIETPKDFRLFQNYPNPFNPTTAIEFDLKKPQKIQLEIFNIVGKKMRTLANENFNSGRHSLVWDGKNDFGENLPSGIYLYALESPYEKVVRKMTLVK